MALVKENSLSEKFTDKKYLNCSSLKNYLCLMEVKMF